MACPVCRSTNTGKVGSNTYYCADCLLEFTEKNGQLEVFYIDAEGTSFALKDMQIAQKLVETIRTGGDLIREEVEEYIKS